VAVGLAGVREAWPGAVEQPAVEGAAYPAVLQPPEGEISTAVRTGAVEQAIAAVVVAEQDEAFAEKAHRLERAVVRQFIDQRGRLPVAPHQLAGGRARARSRQEIVLLGAQHRLISLVPPVGFEFTGSDGACGALMPASSPLRSAGTRPPVPAFTLAALKRARRKPCATRPDEKSKPASRRGRDSWIVPCSSSCA